LPLVASRRVPSSPQWALRRRRGVLTAFACSLLLVAVGGCADLPAGGKPQVLEGNSGQAPGFVQPLPPPGPTATWSPQAVIEGFLHASASFALDRAAAQLYLAPGVKWHPTDVVVVGSIGPPEGPPSELERAAGAKEESFSVEGPRLATLTPSGQYISSSDTRGEYTFTLDQIDGVWRIQQIVQTSPKSDVPADSLLLLDQADFQQVFQARNLYFFPRTTSADEPTYLVPDPVFAPIQGSTVDLAQRLVQGLISGAQLAAAESWLSGETSTYFPAGTLLLGVSISSNLTVTVNLGGTAATVPRTQQQQMYDQLYTTLTSAPVVAASVQLEFNGAPAPFRASSVTSEVPSVGSSQESLYMVAADKYDIYMKSPSMRAVEVAGPAQFSAGEGITAIAATGSQQPGKPQLAIATSNGQGCSVAIGTASARSPGYKTVVLSQRGGPCTSLSWAGNGDLWAAAGSRIWVVSPVPHPQAQSVSLPDGIGGSSPGVMALKVAPDSTRVALLVHTAAGNSLYLAAISYASQITFGPADPLDPVGTSAATQLGKPEGLSWYSANSLAVVAGPASGPQLYEVPLTGGQVQLVGSVPANTDAVSTNGSSIALGTSAGAIMSVSPQNGVFSSVGHGFLPAYPG
jgi:hypothetical protein